MEALIKSHYLAPHPGQGGTNSYSARAKGAPVGTNENSLWEFSQGTTLPSRRQT